MGKVRFLCIAVVFPTTHAACNEIAKAKNGRNAAISKLDNGQRSLSQAPTSYCPQPANARISAIRSDFPSNPIPGNAGSVTYPFSTFTPSGNPPYGWNKSG